MSKPRLEKKLDLSNSGLGLIKFEELLEYFESKFRLFFFQTVTKPLLLGFERKKILPIRIFYHQPHLLL